MAFMIMPVNSTVSVRRDEFDTWLEKEETKFKQFLPVGTVLLNFLTIAILWVLSSQIFAVTGTVIALISSVVLIAVSVNVEVWDQDKVSAKLEGKKPSDDVLISDKTKLYTKKANYLTGGMVLIPLLLVVLNAIFSFA